MRFITLKGHAILDYLVGGGLIAIPFAFGLDQSNAEFLIPVCLGIITIVMSLFTNYPGGIFKRLPFSIHLGIDIFGAVLLGASPWIFSFKDVKGWPYLAVALLELFVVRYTQVFKPDKYAGFYNARRK